MVKEISPSFWTINKWNCLVLFSIKQKYNGDEERHIGAVIIEFASFETFKDTNERISKKSRFTLFLILDMMVSLIEIRSLRKISFHTNDDFRGYSFLFWFLL